MPSTNGILDRNSSFLDFEQAVDGDFDREHPLGQDPNACDKNPTRNYNIIYGDYVSRFRTGPPSFCSTLFHVSFFLPPAALSCLCASARSRDLFQEPSSFFIATSNVFLLQSYVG